MRNSNPVFNSDAFSKSHRQAGSGLMTVNGAISKTFYLLFLVMMSSVATWLYLKTTHNYGSAMVFAGVGSIATLVLLFAIMFKPNYCHVIAPLYSTFQGFSLGAITTVLSLKFGGIAFQAVFATMAVALAMLVAYKLGLIRATEKFRSFITVATGGIFLFYMLNLLLGMFGINIMPARTGMFGMLFTLFVVGIAALNLILDFDNIEEGARSGAPAQMEWMAAFGLIVTLIWLYVEMLRLISILRGDDD